MLTVGCAFGLVVGLTVGTIVGCAVAAGFGSDELVSFGNLICCRGKSSGAWACSTCSTGTVVWLIAVVRGEVRRGGGCGVGPWTASWSKDPGGVLESERTPARPPPVQPANARGLASDYKVPRLNRRQGRSGWWGNTHCGRDRGVGGGTGVWDEWTGQPVTDTDGRKGAKEQWGAMQERVE